MELLLCTDLNPRETYLPGPVLDEMLALCRILVHVLHLAQLDQAVQPDPYQHATQHPKDQAGQGPGEKVRSGDPRVLVGTVGGDEERDEDDGNADGHDGKETYPEFSLVETDCAHM